MKNKRTKGGRWYDLNTTASSDPYVALEHPERGWNTHESCEHISNVRIVASEKCWGGIEEKMPEISREVNQIYWLRIGHVSTLPGDG